MNKKVKWGIIIVIAAGLTGLGIHSLLPHENKELAQAAPNAGNGSRKKALNVNAEIVKEAPLSDGISLTGLLLPDEEVALSFEKSFIRNIGKDYRHQLYRRFPCKEGRTTG